MEFKVDNIFFLGVERGVSRRTKKPYMIGNFYTHEGKIVQCLVECELPADLKPLDKVDVVFRVIPGYYTRLNVTGITKSA